MKLIAILTHDRQAALNQLKREGCVDTVKHARFEGIFTSGREFKVIAATDELAGREIGDYRIIGRPSPELIELARTRLR